MVIRSQFPSQCTLCHNPVVVGAQVDWTNGVGVTHHPAGSCPPPAEPAPERTQDASGIVAFLTAAQSRGLKFPKVRFLAPDRRRELRLSVSGAQSRVPGSVQVTLGREWIGRIEPTGAIRGRLANEKAVLDELEAIAADPAAKAAEYGALMSRCSFCGLALTDQGSIEVGYGPVCAQKYDLPHRSLGTRVVRVAS
jgi:hypothetical protein